ncbi:MAG: hypothetical protein FI723_10890 [SAR202 cluster bacterium]|nr:hypothetical protein [SAR202 cluster bacterium]
MISAAAFLAGFGVACGSQTPEPKFPIPDAHALITPAAFNTGTTDLSVWVPDGWSAPINYDEVSLEPMVTSANRGTTMAKDYSIVLTSSLHRMENRVPLGKAFADARLGEGRSA